MKRLAPMVFAILALILSSLACAAFNKEMSATNLRMAHDQDGKNVTSTFSPTDVMYAVAELENAPQGTAVIAKWVAVNVTNTEAGFEFQKQTLDITDKSFSGTIYFQLANADGWPTGVYRVDIYLNDTLSQSLEFHVE